MPVSLLKTSADSSVVNRALRIGFAQTDELNKEGIPNVKLNDSQQKIVMKIANVLGLSVQSVLNAGIVYALYCMRNQKIRPEELTGYPKRLTGRIIPLELTVETSAQLREAKAELSLGGCLVAGIKLLASRLFD
jgi:hypothetical protein